MTTKDNFLFLKDKKQCLPNDSLQTDTNDQYSNFNLTQNNKVPILISDHSHSKSSKDKFCATFELPDSVVTNKCEEKEKLQPWNRSSDIRLNTLNLNNEEEGKKRWKKDESLNVNNSTLSLHITAYENSSEATATDSNGDKNVWLNTNNKNLHMKNDLFLGLNSIIENQFEFPRQQDGKRTKRPEAMQYNASQRLLNSNQPTSSRNTQLRSAPSLKDSARILKSTSKASAQLVPAGDPNDNLKSLRWADPMHRPNFTVLKSSVSRAVAVPAQSNTNCNSSASTSSTRLSTGGPKIHLGGSGFRPPLNKNDKKQVSSGDEIIRVSEKEAMTWKPYPAEFPICEETRQLLEKNNSSFVLRMFSPPGRPSVDPLTKYDPPETGRYPLRKREKSKNDSQLALQPMVSEGGEISKEDYLKNVRIDYSKVHKKPKTRRCNRQWTFNTRNKDQENFEDINGPNSETSQIKNPSRQLVSVLPSASGRPASSTSSFNWDTPIAADEHGQYDPFEGLGIIHPMNFKNVVSARPQPVGLRAGLRQTARQNVPNSSEDANLRKVPNSSKDANLNKVPRSSNTNISTRKNYSKEQSVPTIRKSSRLTQIAANINSRSTASTAQKRLLSKEICAAPAVLAITQGETGKAPPQKRRKENRIITSNKLANSVSKSTNSRQKVSKTSQSAFTQSSRSALSNTKPRKETLKKGIRSVVSNKTSRQAAARPTTVQTTTGAIASKQIAIPVLKTRQNTKIDSVPSTSRTRARALKVITIQDYSHPPPTTRSRAITSQTIALPAGSNAITLPLASIPGSYSTQSITQSRTTGSKAIALPISSQVYSQPASITRPPTTLSKEITLPTSSQPSPLLPSMQTLLPLTSMPALYSTVSIPETRPTALREIHVIQNNPSAQQNAQTLVVIPPSAATNPSFVQNVRPKRERRPNRKYANL